MLVSTSASGDGPKWSHNNIEEWDNLPDAVCGLGQVQSPIDFNTSADWPAAEESLVISYPNTVPVMVSNNHHGSPQLNLPEGEAYVSLDGEKFQLVQIHFHSPSEETFNGVAPDFDAHLVHQNPETKQLLVIGITFNKGDADSPVLGIALENDPTAESEIEVPVTGVPLASFVPDASMYTFNGSLTTPPCTEGVIWFVSSEISSASSAQIAALKAVGQTQGLENGNARPTQPLNGRSIMTITPVKSAV